MRIPFSKMHGAGNDYVVVDCSAGEPVRDWAAFARYALDRHRGVGGDQLLLVQPASQAAFFMGIRNADGSLAEMCGNGLRAFTKYLRDRGLADADEFDVETLGGVVRVRWLGPDPAAQGRDQDRVELRLFPPILEPEKVPTTLRPESGSGPALEVPLELDGRTLLVSCVSIGNPHCVIFTDDVAGVPLERLGPRIEHHPAFPERTNVEFAELLSAGELVQRTWERGVGETLACGSGACATAVAAILTGRAERELVLHLRGGDLEVRWPRDRGPLWLTGPATLVFDAELDYPGEPK